VLGADAGHRGTSNLYWIVVDPARQGEGVGPPVAGGRDRLTTDHGPTVVVETSSRPDYPPTRAFYERRGYTQAARLAGYYPRDAWYLSQDLTHGVLATATA